MTNIHQLLPWFANRTLPPEEKAAFENHLAGCSDCRAELEMISGLQADLDEHGADLLGDHPAPEALMLAADPAVRRHLALCATCSEEAGWLTGSSVAAAIEEDRTVAGHARPSWVTWGGWVTAAAAVLLLILLRPSGPAGPEEPATGLVSLAVVRSVERDSASLEVAVGPEARAVHLLFEGDLAPSDFPASFEVTGPGGRVVHRADSLEVSDLLQGVLIGFTCARRDCPDGEYRSRLTTSDPDRPETLYLFRLTTAEGSSRVQ